MHRTRAIGTVCVLVLAMILGTSGAMAQDGTARVRVVHAAPDTPAVDVFVDGTVAASNVAFQSIGKHMNVPAGAHTIALAPTGQAIDQAILTIDATFDANTAYTIVAIGLDEVSAAVFTDDLTAPPAGQARVRFIHTSPDAPGVDIEVINGPTLFTDIGFGEASPYQDVAGSTYDLRAVTTGASTVIVQLPGTTVEAGTIYDVIAVGRLADLQVVVGTFTPPAEAVAGASGEIAAAPNQTMPSVGAVDTRGYLLALALIAIIAGWLIGQQRDRVRK